MNTKNLKFTQIDNKITYKGKKLEIYRIARKDSKKISRHEMIEICSKVQRDMRKQHSNGYISITIQYPDKYYTKGISNLNSDLKYFSKNDYDGLDNDPEEYTSFIVNFIPISSKPKGGKDEHNDCLINCIKEALQSQRERIKAEEVKQYLRLNRDDMIPINKIQILERHINYILRNDANNQIAINVSGDFTYTSQLKTVKSIDVVLADEHYSLNESTIYTKKYFSHKERQLIVYDGNEMFDGSNKSPFDIKAYWEAQAKPRSSKTIYVSKDYVIRNLKKCYKDMPLEDAYNSYHDMATLLKEENKYFNLFKCDIKHSALNNFYSKVQMLHPEEITNNEAKFIEEATFSALTYWEPFNDAGHSYDINSHYPHIMSLSRCYFPIKKGEYKTVETIDEKDYGIYRCIITNPTKKPMKLFAFNKSNHYTSTDVKHALEYGLTVELIQDDQPNFLYYSKDKIVNGAYMFKNYINELFDLKTKKIEGAKLLLNILWGALCQKNSYKHIKRCDEPFELNDCELVGLAYDGRNIITESIPYHEAYYETNYARIKPFIISYGRYYCYHKFRAIEDDIIRVHTDGVMTKKAVEMEESDKLGGIKYEYYKQVEITGLNKLVKMG